MQNFLSMAIKQVRSWNAVDFVRSFESQYLWFCACTKYFIIPIHLNAFVGWCVTHTSASHPFFLSFLSSLLSVLTLYQLYTSLALFHPFFLHCAVCFTLRTRFLCFVCFDCYYSYVLQICITNSVFKAAESFAKLIFTYSNFRPLNSEGSNPAGDDILPGETLT